MNSCKQSSDFFSLMSQQDLAVKQIDNDQQYSLSSSNSAVYAGNRSVVQLNHDIEISSKQYIFLDSAVQASFDITCSVKESADISYHIICSDRTQLRMNIAFLQGENITCSLYLYMQGEYGQALVNGMYALDNDQNVTINTYQYHYAPDTKSSLVMKGMLKDRSKALYHGLIFIDKGAMRTDASQQNKNILLSKDAKVISEPTIEVLQHDVQCCHGSAIGQFSDEHLYYLQSRGLSKSVAQELLVQSFFEDVVGDGSVKEKRMELLCKKMI